MSRVDIVVPYFETGVAQALGAKWDQEKMTWYIPDGVEEELFKAWIPRQKTSIYIVVGECECSKCGKDTTVIALGIPYGEAYDLDEDDIADGVYPGYDSSTYSALALLPRIDSMPKELRDYLEQTYQYKPKFSTFTERTQLGNCCDSCGSLQDEFYLFEELDGCFVILDEGDLDCLQFYEVEIPGMIYGLVDRWSPSDAFTFSYAKQNSEKLELNLIENLFI